MTFVRLNDDEKLPPTWLDMARRLRHKAKRRVAATREDLKRTFPGSSAERRVARALKRAEIDAGLWIGRVLEAEEPENA